MSRGSSDSTDVPININNDDSVSLDHCVELVCSGSMLTHRGRFQKTCQLVWTTLIPAVALVAYSIAEFAIDVADYDYRQHNLKPDVGDVEVATTYIEIVRRVQSLRLVSTMYLASAGDAATDASSDGDGASIVADFLSMYRNDTVFFIVSSHTSSVCNFAELLNSYNQKVNSPLHFLHPFVNQEQPSTSFCSVYDYAVSNINALVNHTLHVGGRGNISASDIGSTFQMFTRVIDLLILNFSKSLTYTGKSTSVTKLMVISKSLVTIEESYSTLQSIGALNLLDADGGQWGAILRNTAIGLHSLADQNFRKIRLISGDNMVNVPLEPPDDVRAMINDVLSVASLSTWLTTNKFGSPFIRQQSVVLARWIDGFQNLAHMLLASTNTSLGNAKILIEKEREAIGKWIGLAIFDWILVFILLVPLVLVNAGRNMAAVQAYTISFESKEIELRLEKRKTEALLNEMLPRSVRLKLQRGVSTATLAAEQYDSATIYFSDVTDFAELSAMYNPMQVIIILNEIYSFMDELIPRFDVYKVETISCVYMVVSGVPTRNGDRHAAEIARMSIDIIRASKKFRIDSMPDVGLNLRIGLHTGPVVAGVVGNKMPRYCLFGDTVNTASRMQSNGLPHQIHVSEETYRCLCNYDDFNLKSRGTISIKGKGNMHTYWLLLDKTQNSIPMEGDTLQH